MKKVLLVQPSLQPPGGANGVGAWIIEALKSECSLSVLTWTPVERASINRYYGTSLCPTDFSAHQIHPILRWTVDCSPISLDYLKFSILLRCCNKIKDHYDVIISANNEADFGCRGIQYINFPRHYHPLVCFDPPGNGVSSMLIRVYHRFCMRISGFSFERMKKNLTLVNSNWTRRQFRECYGIAATTLYPPIAGDFPNVPWQDRENGFVCIGRITPEKELDKIIDILAAVRSRGCEAHLHIVGSPNHRAYYDRLRERIRQNSAWIFLEQDLSRQELLRLISIHRYGIHGMKEEHFGMAVAELVRGGCLTFVPNGGGQVEIVSGNDPLLYRTTEEAAESIVRVMRDPELQHQLRLRLKANTEIFLAQHFTRRLREFVRAFRKV